MNLFGFYFVLSVVSAVIFIATAFILLKKYSTRGIKLHLWAAISFLFLTAQELIVAYWLIDFEMGGVLFYSRPWHLQALLVFFAFTLLGLSITGIIKD